MWEPGYDPERDQKVENLAERIFDLLSALPRRNDTPPNDGKIHRWAKLLAQSTPWRSPFENGMKPAKRAIVQKELLAFSKNIKAAEKALLSFHNPSFGKALEEGTSVWEIRQSLDAAIKFANAIDGLSLSDIPENITRGREHHGADVVAQRCAMYFYWITGRAPGRVNKDGEKVQSQFTRLLADVFILIDIDASADERARHAASQFKTKWGKRSADAD